MSKRKSKPSPIAYGWADGSQHKTNAQAVGEEIEDIRLTKGKFFKPIDVVDRARPKESVLHPEFEWVDKIAAEAYRADQARYVVRSIVVVNLDEPDEEPVRAFVSVRMEAGDSKYTSTTYAISRIDLREDVLAQALSALQAFQRKYSHLLDLSETMDAFTRAMKHAKDEHPEYSPHYEQPAEAQYPPH